MESSWFEPVVVVGGVVAAILNSAVSGLDLSTMPTIHDVREKSRC